MRKIDVSAITLSTGMPLKQGTLEHLQFSYIEAIAEAVKGLIGFAYDAGSVYILNGLVNSGSGSNYDISAGSVFYNGEVYLIPAAVFTIAGPNVAVGVVTTSFYVGDGTNADPIEFTDGVPRNILQIRRIIMQSGLSGSGAGNYVNFIDVGKRLHGSLGEIKIWNWNVLGGVITDYFNGGGLGIHPYTLGWARCNGGNGTVNMEGLAPVGYIASDPDFADPFVTTGGAKTHTLTTPEIPSHTHTFAMGDGSSGTVMPDHDGANPLNTQNATMTTSATGGGGSHNNLQPYRAVLYVQRIA